MVIIKVSFTHLKKKEYQIITYSLKPKQIIYKVILEFIMIDYGFWKKING